MIALLDLNIFSQQVNSKHPLQFLKYSLGSELCTPVGNVALQPLFFFVGMSP